MPLLSRSSSSLADSAAAELEPQRRETDGAVRPLPRHVAIIMDGNGRWAHAHGLPRGEGHRRGVEALRRAVRFAGAPRHPLPDAVQLLLGELVAAGGRDRGPVQPRAHLHPPRPRGAERATACSIRVIGEREPLPADIRGLIEEAEGVTAGNRGLQLVVAFNYGARDEIVRAARELAERVARGEIDPRRSITRRFEQALDTAGIPDPDLIIRTSGEQRISNFLLWQAAYAELVFLPVLWPDFGDADFEAALDRILPRASGATEASLAPEQAAPTGQSELRTRIVSAAVLAPVALAAVLVGGLPFAALVALVAAIAFWEWTAIVGASEPLGRCALALACLVAGLIALVASPDRLAVVFDRGAGLARACRRDMLLPPLRWIGLGLVYVARALRRPSSCCGRPSRSAGRPSFSFSLWSGRPTSPPILAVARSAARSSGRASRRRRPGPAR